MSSSEKFSLKWNDFQENITAAFATLRDDKRFTDVTLVSEDGEPVEAHKVILSVSSPFFMNILKLNKHSNPLIYLKGFKAKELHSLIDFIYNGVADVYQDDLDLFLEKAEELQLKGLTGGGEDTQKQGKEETVQNHKEPRLKLDTETKSLMGNPEEELYTDAFGYGKYDSNSTTTVMTTVKSSPNVSFNGGTFEDLKSTIWSMITQEGKVLTCTVCGKTTDRSLSRHAREHMERHVESLHVDGVTYDCTRCDKTFRSKRTFQRHAHVSHEN